MKTFQVYKKIPELGVLMHIRSEKANSLIDAIELAKSNLNYKYLPRSKFLESYNVSGLVKPSLGL